MSTHTRYQILREAVVVAHVLGVRARELKWLTLEQAFSMAEKYSGAVRVYWGAWSQTDLATIL